LGVSNSHVQKDIDKINNGKELSPLLLVRNLDEYKVIIADGYHRLCAIYTIDEDALIPCKIVY
jgi:disulfide oxidoreductase YuzD